MPMKAHGITFENLGQSFKGALYYDSSPTHQTHLLAYSTDASVYQQKPLAVAIPVDSDDIRQLVHFAKHHKITLIPRAAGTSLAGQVVGDGIVVDTSIHFNRIKEVNVEERWVRVQPGVIRDDLNHHLMGFGLMFGPETSTANRAMIGGMVGNNSCGLHSIVWGAVRDHLLEVTAILSDGSEVVFAADEIGFKDSPKDFKNRIYNGLFELLSDKNNRQLIRDNFPKASVVRRNSGYALDSLMAMDPFTESGEAFNLCKLIAGSEGTLCIITDVKLALMSLPPRETAVVCIHCHSVDEALRANITALKHHPMASELVDKYILDFTIGHPEYHKNRFFIDGDPAAILMVEFMEETASLADMRAVQLISDLQQEGYGYSWPVLYNEQTKFAWEVRKAGLGLLRNLKGDIQPVNLIEDYAVAPEELPEYIQDLQQLLKRHEVNASYYAHAGAGELHVEPMINLKTQEGVNTFRKILSETVELVKKYRGSLSGEHGDGRLRGEFIPAVVGGETYELFKKVKHCFDPKNIFNAGKITNTPRIESNLRIHSGEQKIPVKTNFDFSATDGILRLAEKCSGSGDCRKSAISGGVMCPSYMATRQEKDTTRARANVLRQFLSNEHDQQPFNHSEIKEVMDLCLSCKGCKTECPSGVDVTKMKAEFLQHYYDQNGIPFRTKLIAGFSKQMKYASRFSWAWNFVFQNKILRRIGNRMVGFHPHRSMPLVSGTTLRNWHKKRKKGKLKPRKVYLFCDEFTNYNDVEIGKKTILLLESLNFEVVIPEHLESGRTYLSKGLVKKAKDIANQNIVLLSELVSSSSPLIGVEPSAILTFRDEYIDLADASNRSKAIALSKQTFTIEEFVAREAKSDHIRPDHFTTESRSVVIHGHCYQKSLSSQADIQAMLSLPVNYSTSLIPSGCCGMAGSFGYEKEHYQISQQIGAQVLYPAVRKLAADVLLVSSGTSCRHQIKDGTNRRALHPVEVLFDALCLPDPDR
jgi:FAD/FMN-containing dehydrogenase/Fe-S oxidoreductase